MDGEARTTMTVTLDPTLLRWVSRGANRSETVETIIRSAWRKNMAHQRGMAKNHKDLMDPAYSYQPGRQNHINAIEICKNLLSQLHSPTYKINSDRFRMLTYELRSFIEAGVPSDE